MSNKTSRGNLLALRERYLWLWRQLHKLEERLKAFPSASQESIKRDLWAQRMKQQLKRYWP